MSGEPNGGTRLNRLAVATLLLTLASHSRGLADGTYDSLLAPASVETTLGNAADEQVVPASLLLGEEEASADPRSLGGGDAESKPATPRLPYRRVFSGAYDVLNDSEPDVAAYQPQPARVRPAPVVVYDESFGYGVIADFDDIYLVSAYPSSVAEQRAKLGGLANFELMHAQVLHAPRTWKRGWRFDGYLHRGHVAFGDEVAPLVTSTTKPTGWRSAWYRTAGLRTYSYELLYEFEGLGSILGRTFVGQYNEHFILGPQLGIGYVAERSIWRLEAKLLGLAGYGHLDAQQQGVFGEELIPGALNRPGSARTTRTSAEASEDFLAWHGEARVGVGCQVTKRVRADVTYRYIVAGPSYDAAKSILRNAPDFGVQVPEPQTADLHSVFVGASYLW